MSQKWKSNSFGGDYLRKKLHYPIRVGIINKMLALYCSFLNRVAT